MHTTQRWRMQTSFQVYFLGTRTIQVFFEACKVLLLKTSIPVSVRHLRLTCQCFDWSHRSTVTHSSQSTLRPPPKCQQQTWQHQQSRNAVPLISTSHTQPELSPLLVINWKLNFLGMYSLIQYLIYTSNARPSILGRTQLAVSLIIYQNNILSFAWAQV